MHGNIRMPRAYEATDAEIRRHVEAYMKTGIAVLVTDRTKPEPAMCARINIRMLLKAIAIEDKRPFVRAERSIGKGVFDQPVKSGWTITMPQQDRTRAMVAPLLVVARESPNSMERPTDKVPVLRRLRSSVWSFDFFNNDAAEELFNGWLEHCRVNPECRVALRLSATVPTL